MFREFGHVFGHVPVFVDMGGGGSFDSIQKYGEGMRLAATKGPTISKSTRLIQSIGLEVTVVRSGGGEAAAPPPAQPEDPKAQTRDSPYVQHFGENRMGSPSDSFLQSRVDAGRTGQRLSRSR